LKSCIEAEPLTSGKHTGCLGAPGRDAIAELIEAVSNQQPFYRDPSGHMQGQS
jgi:hypothetical protein